MLNVSNAEIIVELNENDLMIKNWTSFEYDVIKLKKTKDYIDQGF
jgi:hypothetical protein